MRERERVHGRRGRGRREERESRAESLLSVKPSVGLGLMTMKSWHELKSRIRHLTDWATQAPLKLIFYNITHYLPASPVHIWGPGLSIANTVTSPDMSKANSGLTRPQDASQQVLLLPPVTTVLASASEVVLTLDLFFQSALNRGLMYFLLQLLQLLLLLESI